MFRCDARGHGEANGLWAPEEGCGAVGGPWGARMEGGVTGMAQTTPRGDARFTVGDGGDDMNEGGFEMEQAYEDELEFEIASF